MKELSLGEIKSVELEILIYIDKLCRENNINYSLDGGTLIGAVRHKGFIPWDDDIDIVLMRDDYNRLLNLLRKDDRYTTFIPGETENYFYGFAKVTDKRTIMRGTAFEQKLHFPSMGVFVDIFALDNIEKKDLPENIKQIKGLLNKAIIANRSGDYYFSDSKFKDAIKKVIFIPQHILYSKHSTAFWMAKAIKMAEMHLGENTEYLGDYFGELTVNGRKKHLWPRSIFNGYTEKEFEGHNLMVFSEYDKYLRILFGDYMKLPPKEEQVAPHDYSFFRK